MGGQVDPIREIADLLEMQLGRRAPQYYLDRAAHLLSMGWPKERVWEWISPEIKPLLMERYQRYQAVPQVGALAGATVMTGGARPRGRRVSNRPARAARQEA